MFITEHPFISIGVGVGTIAIVSLICTAVGVSIKRNKNKLKEDELKKSENSSSVTDIKAEQLKWSQSKESELQANVSFAEYLDLCTIIRNKRKKLNALRLESEKLQNEIMELSVNLEELYSRLTDEEIIGSNEDTSDVYEERKKIKSKLKDTQDHLKNIYEKTQKLSDEIRELEEKRGILSDKYKDSLKNLENVKLK